MKRATPDSNILVSAIVFGGKPGDKHLLSLGEFSGIRIQRVSEFLAELHS